MSVTHPQPLPIGTRVQRAPGIVYPGLPGEIVGYDNDLGLPLIAWDAHRHLGVEACDPEEYEVSEDRSPIGAVAALDTEIRELQESDESLRDRRDDLRKDAESEDEALSDV